MLRSGLELLCCLSITTVALAADAPSTQRSDPAAERARVLRGTLATYDGEPRLVDKHVDIERLLTELKDLKVNTYNWLIWHEDTDWEDLHQFLPLARKAGIRVWVTVVPPSESPPRTRRYSEPFRLDYQKWAVEIARLSLREPNLVAWSIDDFLHNTETFAPDKLRPIISAAREINPRLAFAPCCYYRQVKRGLAKGYGDLLDGVLFPYRNESVEADLKDAGQVEREVKDLRAAFGPDVPIIVDVYATPHSRLGASTPEYVGEVIRAARATADGVMIYCHQDPRKQPQKYRVIRDEFRKDLSAGVPRLDGKP